MESVNYWVEHQGSRSSVSDTSWMVPTIEGDRVGRPRIKFGGNGLNSVYVSDGAFVRSLWDVSCINHIYCFDFWWEFFLSSSVRLTRLLLVLTWRLPPLLFGVQLAGLFENTTLSVGVVCMLFGGAVDLTQLV